MGQPNLRNRMKEWNRGTEDEVRAWRKNTGNNFLGQEISRIISTIKE